MWSARRDYNKHMGGVDLGDQYHKYYQVRMKSCKDYKYIFWFLFEISILNSYILYRYSACTSKNFTYLDYRVELAKLLIGNCNNRKRPGQPLSTPSTKRITLHNTTLQRIPVAAVHTAKMAGLCGTAISAAKGSDTLAIRIHHTLHGLF